MNRTLIFLVLWGCAGLIAAERDPFWPIDHVPSGAAPAVPPPEGTPAPPPARELTDAELRQLAEREAMKIKEILDRKATAVFGGRVHALVNGDWVSQGDSLTVEVLGNTYQLKIVQLTPNHIQLEPLRTP